MVYVPPRKLNQAELQLISRSFGIHLSKIIDTAVRVEEQRCSICGTLMCAHEEDEVSS